MKKGIVFAAALVTAATMGMSMTAMAAGIDIDGAKKVALEAVRPTEQLWTRMSMLTTDQKMEPPLRSVR